MTRAEIETRLRAVVCDQFYGETIEITNAMRFVEDLGADSFDGIELVMAVEEQFQLAIDDDEYDHVKTFKDAVDLLEAKLNGTALKGDA